MANLQKISGIVCEFNPLHQGHQLILNEAKKHGVVACVMSGNFVQRGEPAILDKWARTEMALGCGANLVIELPLPWAMSGAEHFAGGAVFLLNALGCEGSVVFGSECGDTQPLMHIAKRLLSKDFERSFAENLRGSTRSYAAVREETLRQLTDGSYADLLRQPNNILGIEYCKALLRTGSRLRARTIRRRGSGHDQKAARGELRAAGELRRMLHAGLPVQNDVPDVVGRHLNALRNQGKLPASLEKLEIAVLCKLRTLTPEDFAKLPDISEGLEFRLYEAVKNAGNLQELYDGVKSKRYAHARIRRLIMNAFLGVGNSLPQQPPYLRILGMDDAGERLLRQKTAMLPVCIRPKDFTAAGDEVQRLFRLEVRADDLYALSFPTPQPAALDYTTRFIRI